VPLHGAQERAHFHLHYDNNCELPLYVFAGGDLLACVLRPSDLDPAKVLSAPIKLFGGLRRAAADCGGPGPTQRNSCVSAKEDAGPSSGLLPVP
jgi:hypothetical protein